MSSTSTVILVVIALTLLAPAALGMDDITHDDPTACDRPVLDLSAAPPERFEPGEARTTYVVLTNPNDVAGQATLRVAAAPERWTVSVAQTALTVEPRSQAEFTVTILPPARGVGADQGPIRLEASLVCQGLPSESPTTAQTFQVQLAVFSLTWLVVSVGAALLLIAIVVVLVLLGRRRSVHVSCDARQKTLTPGAAASYTLHVENRSTEAAKYTLSLRGLRGKWEGFLAVAEVELDAGEAQELWVNLRAPEKAKPGDEGRAVVVAARVGNPRDRVTLHLRAKVLPAPTPPAAATEAAGPKP